jgi:oryzin
MLPSILFLLSLVPAALTAPVPASDIVQGKYIVTLKPGVATDKVEKHVEWVKHVHARSIARRDGSEKGVDKVWKATDAFKAYSGEFDKDTIKKINDKDEVRLQSHLSPRSRRRWSRA